MIYSSEILVGGERVRLPSELPPGSRAEKRANSVFIPLGPLHSRAFLLLSLASVRTLATSDNPARTINWNQVGGGAKSLSLPGWYLFKAERLLYGGVGDEKAICLCEFVDARYRASKSHSTDNVLANIRSYADSNDYLAGTTTYNTWSLLVQKLWEDCGVLGSFPGLPSDLPIDGVPQNQFFLSADAWKSLNAVLDLLDCAVCPNVTSAGYTITRLGGTQTLPDNATRLQWDGEPVRSLLDVAEELRINYYYHRKSYGQERDTEQTANWAVSGVGDAQTVSTDLDGATGTKVLWDDLPWLLDEDNTHTNLAAINARTANRKSRYVTRHSVSPAHKVYSGLLDDYLPGKRVRAVIFRDWGDGDVNPLGGTVTEYLCGPELVTDFPEVNSEGRLDWYHKGALTYEQENYLGPDLGRKSYPNYPRLPNIVQVYHSAGTVGTVVSPNSSKLHPGLVRRYVSGALAILGECWIRFVDDHDTNLGNVTVKDGDCFLARLSGMETHEGVSRPLYVCRSDSSDSLVRFKLTAALDLAGSATARPCLIDGDDWVADTTKTITVMDPYDDPGCWMGEIGYEGFCVKRPPDKDTGVWDQKYDIVWMERPALIVEWQALTNRADDAESFTVRIRHYYQQGNKKPPGASPDGETPSEENVEVWDDDFLFPWILAGCRGKAIWDDRDEKYRVFIAQQRCLRFKATSTGDVCAGGTVAISGASLLTPSPIGYLPAVSELMNPLKINVMTNDVVIGEWDPTLLDSNENTGAYFLSAAQEHEQYVLTAWRFNTATGCYQYKRRKGSFHFCEEESDWIDDECGDLC